LLRLTRTASDAAGRVDEGLQQAIEKRRAGPNGSNPVAIGRYQGLAEEIISSNLSGVPR